MTLRSTDRFGSPGAARRLIRSLDRAALATTMEGRPYVSLVVTACAGDASPLLLLSDLAQHTANLRADPRVALLFDGSGGFADPLAGPRLSLLGRAEPCADDQLFARFLARHPSAAGYAGFGDFRLYRVAVERGHLVAGFGRIAWIAGDELRLAADDAALAAAEPDILAHMNADHAAALDLCAARLAGRGGTGWRMTGIDPEGVDLRREGEVARLDFPALVSDADSARAALIALVAAARAAPPAV
jgi:putative heme iron utilization protein